MAQVVGRPYWKMCERCSVVEVLKCSTRARQGWTTTDTTRIGLPDQISDTTSYIGNNLGVFSEINVFLFQIIWMLGGNIQYESFPPTEHDTQCARYFNILFCSIYILLGNGVTQYVRNILHHILLPSDSSIQIIFNRSFHVQRWFFDLWSSLTTALWRLLQ